MIKLEMHFITTRHPRRRSEILHIEEVPRETDDLYGDFPYLSAPLIWLIGKRVNK